ncbi:MAG: hypothetical protein INR69_21800 [Mucilaginibacter polytrichastri]|nr:hypothetical protein [Mucilaginibacter polytrichastri]
MRNKLLYLLLLLLPQFAAAQNSAAKEAAKKQAAAMDAAYAKGDYITMANYTNKRVLDMLGGPQKMAAALKGKMAELEKKNVKLISAEVGEVMQIVNVDGQYQCIIPQYIRMKAGDEKMYSRSHLLGISSDKGKTWTFLDANGQTPEMLKGLFPNLSKELVIPKKEMKVEEADLK